MAGTIPASSRTICVVYSMAIEEDSASRSPGPSWRIYTWSVWEVVQWSVTGAGPSVAGAPVSFSWPALAAANRAQTSCGNATWRAIDHNQDYRHYF